MSTNDTTPTIPSKPITQGFALNVPVTVDSTQATIKVNVRVVHRPHKSFNIALRDWVETSIQTTLEDQFKNDLKQIQFIAQGGIFTMSPSIPSFQKNIGLHSTEIESLHITIPYLYAQEVIHDRSKDGVHYCATASICYQSQTRADISEPDAKPLKKQAKKVLDENIEQFKGHWCKQTLNDLIETFPTRSQFEKDCFIHNQNYLDLEVYEGLVVLKTVHIMDSVVLHDLATALFKSHQVSHKSRASVLAAFFGCVGRVCYDKSLRAHYLDPAYQRGVKGETGIEIIDSCRAHAGDKDQVLDRAIWQSLLWGSLSTGVVGAIHYGLDGHGVMQCLLSMGLVFAVGPIGVLAGFLF